MYKPIVGFEKHYNIHSCGEVYSIKSNSIISKSLSNSGYYQVQLYKNNIPHRFYIHRLVALHFIPLLEEFPNVNHKDGNKLNNDVSNLEWSDKSHNAFHAISLGLRTYSNRLTRQEFLMALEEVLQGSSYKKLCEKLPYKVPFLSTKLRKIAKEEGKEKELDDSLYEQKIIRALKNLESINIRKK